MKEIFTRRSVRKFTAQAVENEKIEKLLRAAMQAPSARNQQPWEFVVLRDAENIKRLSRFSPYATPLLSAPLAFVVAAKEDNLPAPSYWPQDLAAAVQNILLEAVHLGLGAVWMGVAPIEDRMKYIGDMLAFPANVKAFAAIAIGYPAQEVPPIDRYQSERVHYEKY